MQSALWKIVTAIGIVGIGTLVVLEVHQNLQPMPAGSASGQHVAGGANGEPGTSVDSPFYSADSADGEHADHSHGDDSSHFDEHSAESPATGKAPDAKAAGAHGLASVPSDLKNPVLTNAAAPASVDTNVRVENLTDDADPFGIPAAVPGGAGLPAAAPGSETSSASSSSVQSAAAQKTPDAGDSKNVTVASFQSENLFGQEQPFESDKNSPSDSNSANGGGNANESAGTGDATIPSLEVPAGAGEDNPFGSAFQPDSDSAAGKPETDVNEPDPLGPPENDPRSETPRAVPTGEDLPALTLPGSDSEPAPFVPDGAPTETRTPAFDDRSAVPPRTDRNDSRPRTDEGRGNVRDIDDRGRDSADERFPSSPSGSGNTRQPTDRRGSSIMFFGNGNRNAPSRQPEPERDRRLPLPDDSLNRDDSRNDEPFRRDEPSADEGRERETPPDFDGDVGRTPDRGREPIRPTPDRDIPSGRDTIDRESRDRLSRDRDARPEDRDFPTDRSRTPPSDDRQTPDRRPESSSDMFEPDNVLQPVDVDRNAPDRENNRPSPAEPEPSSQVMRPHLTLRKDAPETASVGVPLEYRIEVTNEGGSPAFDVIVEDDIPRSADIDSTNPEVSELDQKAKKMIWRFESLKPGGKEEIRVRLTPRGEGTLGGVATVRFKAQVKATTVVTAPKLALEMDGPGEAKSGDELEYRYVVRNDGSGTANDVILRTVLPAGLKHTEGDDLEYEIGTLKPSEERTVTLAVVAAKPGDFKNIAEVSSAGDAMAERETDVRIIGSQIKVERMGPERRYLNSTAEFINIVTNETRFPAMNIEVREAIPDGMKFVSAGKGGQYDRSQHMIVWNIDRIEPDKAVNLDVQLMPEVAGEHQSLVEVHEERGFKSHLTRNVSIEHIHKIGADTSRLDGPVMVGARFQFSITIENQGTADATGVSLRVNVPEEIRILEGGSVEGNIVAKRLKEGNGIVFDTVAKIEPKQKKVFRLVLQGQQQITNGAIEGTLSYDSLKKPLIVSEAVTVVSENP
ncbi:MAG: hypothetical protein ACK526_20755 [Planctomyces sp.]